MFKEQPMRVEKAEIFSFVKNAGKNSLNKVQKSLTSKEAILIGESAIAGALPILYFSKFYDKEANDKKFKSELSTLLAVSSIIPLNKQVQKFGDSFIKNSQSSIKPVATKILKGSKYALPVINALFIAPLVVSKVLFPLNSKLEKLSKSKKESYLATTFK